MNCQARWEIVQARIGEFNRNVADLWEMANPDQRVFLMTLASLSLLFFLTVTLLARWRIVNRHEIKKVKHLSAMRSLILEKEVKHFPAMRSLMLEKKVT